MKHFPINKIFTHKERYEIFDGNLVEIFKIFVQNFDPIRAVLMGTKSCIKILILLKIFPTRFRFTF